MSTAYLLGDSDPELRRLSDQHLVWSEVTHAGWRRAGLRARERVLDVGCGPGFTTVELARLVGPAGSVVGLDPSPRFNAYLDEVLRAGDLGHVERHEASIDTFEDLDGFDLIHVRWVLCFLPDVDAAIRKLASLLRPGGRLVTLDYFNYAAFAMAPRIETMASVVAAIGAAWDQSGGSLDVQGETPRACEAAGLEVTQIEQISGTARPGEPRFRWPQSFLEGFVPRLVADGLLTRDIADQFWAGWHARVSTPGAFLYLPPMLQIIAR
ncbi:MAG: methyltransferase, partial [Pseudomonadota bacterium]